MNKKVAGASSSHTQKQWEQDAPATTPKLRFPEFRGAGEWRLEAGNALFDQINDRNPELGLPILAITQEHGAIPRQLIDYHVSVSEKSLESYKVVRIGDFIISLRSFQGGIEYSRYRGICSPAYVILRRRGNGNDEYFRHYLKTDRFIQILTKNLEGLRDGKMVSYTQFSELLIPTPTLAEQQRIADCLSSLDALIAAQARKVDALKTHKKGLMQQLFPRDGETQPRLRFPEFQDAGEWDSDSLGDVATFVNEKISLERVALENYISTENIMPDYGGVAKAAKLPTTGSVTRYRPNDTLVSNIRPYLKKVWVADKEGGASNDVIVIRAKERLHPQYFSCLLKNDTFIDYVMTGAKGVKMPRGDIDSIKVYPTLYPSLAEQQRIADCLSSLDALIAAAAQQLETLKTHKRGLMQQLFPTVAGASSSGDTHAREQDAPATHPYAETDNL